MISYFNKTFLPDFFCDTESRFEAGNSSNPYLVGVLLYTSASFESKPPHAGKISINGHE